MSTVEAEIVIVGGGPAGIAAACCAAEAGRRVLVVDANPSLGGQVWRGAKASPWLTRFANSGAQHLANHEVIGRHDTDLLQVATTDGGQTKFVRYQKLLLATGARELLLPIPGWTLPGFFGAGGLQALVKGGLSIAGKRVVVAGSGPLLLAVAATLLREGADLRLLAEQAPLRNIILFGGYLLRSHWAKLREAVTLRRALKGIPYRTGCWIRSIHGEEHVAAVTLTDGVRRWEEPCDYVACGFGLVANLELPLLMGCEVRDNQVVVNSIQQSTAPNIFCAGEAVGIGGLETALVEGQIAGLAMSEKLREAQALFSQRARQRRFAARLETAFRLREDMRRLADPDTIVCRCEDVQLQGLQHYFSWREAKLQSRCGMGPCQGRICGPACEYLFNWKVDSVRPPVLPCRVGQLIGDESAAESS